MKKKIGNYLAARNDLELRYLRLINEADPAIKQSIHNLYEFDLLNYSYLALKTYYDISKSKWDLDYRNILDDLASVNTRIESKLPIHELCETLPQLQVLRREQRENAREAGKIAHLMISSSASVEDLTLLVNDFDVPQLSSRNLLTNTLTTELNLPAINIGKPDVPRARKDVASERARSTTKQKQAKSNQMPEQNSTKAKKKSTPRTISNDNELVVSTRLPTSPEYIAIKPAVNNNMKQKDTYLSSIPNTPIQPDAFRILEDTQGVSFVEPETKNDAENSTNVPFNSSTKKSSSALKSGPESKKRATASTPAAADQIHKRTKNQENFSNLLTWTREHVACLVNAAMDSSNPTSSIQKVFKDKFDVSLSADEANTLRLHYGLMEPSMKRYKYYIQAFRLVASYFFENRNEYVVTPWEEIRLQFARKADFNLPDWETRGRFYLYLLHRSVYGRVGEPSSNYGDLVAGFQKKMQPERISLLPSPPVEEESLASEKGNYNIAFSPSSKIPQTQTLQYPKASQNEWKTPDIEALVEAECNVPVDANYRTELLMRYIKLKTGKQFSISEIDLRRKQKDVLTILKQKKVASKSAVKKTKNVTPPKETGVSPSTQPTVSQFNALLSKIASEAQSDAYYESKIPKVLLTKFWDLGKSKSLISTVEYISRIDPNTADVVEKVARVYMIKIVRLRFLREHQVQALAEVIESRLKRMMEMDVFNEVQCKLLNAHFLK